MQNVISLITKRKLSTQRVDDMASNAARLALDERVTRMLAAHALQPAPVRTALPTLTNPIQINSIS